MRRFTLLPVWVALTALALAAPAAAAKRALIVVQGGSQEGVTAAGHVHDELVGRGFEVVETGSVPGDLSPYCCVWDIRSQAPLSNGERSAYLAFVGDGHGLMLFGENMGFDLRNQSIAAFLRDDAGGGNVQVNASSDLGGSTEHVANNSNPVTNSPFNINSVTYDGFAAGIFLGLGSGTSLTIYPPDGSVTGASWAQNDLGAAKDGRVAVTLDINWLVQTFNTTDNAKFLSNIAEFLCPTIDASFELKITSPQTFNKECPATVDVFGTITATADDCAQATSFAPAGDAVTIAAAPPFVRDAGSTLAWADGPDREVDSRGPPALAAGGVSGSILSNPAAPAAPSTIVEVKVSVNGGPFNPVFDTTPNLPADPPVDFETGDLTLAFGNNTIKVRAKNAAGASAEDSISGTLFDTKDPVITIGTCDDETVDLGPGCELKYKKKPTATDLCDPDVNITSVPPLPLDFTGPGSQSITYTAHDDAGNTAKCTRLVTAVDLSPPEITCAAPLTLECKGPGALPDTDPDVQAWLNSTTAIDNCTDPPALSDDHPAFFPFACPPGAGTDVTWTASDASGHSSNCSSTLSVTDSTAPELTLVPPALTLECNVVGGRADSDSDVVAWLAQFDATDLCSTTVDKSNDAPAFFPAGCAPGVTTDVKFTASDECANAAVHVAGLTVVDSAPPSLNAPAPATFECKEQGGTAKSDGEIAAWLGSATTSDICAVPTLSNDAPALLPGSCTGTTTTVGFTASDGCQIAQGSSTATVIDRTAPELTVPAPITLECQGPQGVPESDAAIVAWLNSATASDLCGAASLADNHPAYFASDCTPGHATSVKFTASDACGFTTSLTATVFVRDTTAPGLSVPAPITIECKGQGGTPKDDPAVKAWLDAAVATDLCGAASVSNDAAQVLPSGCAPGTTTTVTFTGSDACGNQITDTATITVRDTTAPAVTPPPPLTIECSAQGGTPKTDAAAADWLASATSADVCGQATTSEDAPQLFPSACAPGAATTVLFTGSDDCNNAASATSVLTVVDTTPPALEVPPPLGLECNAPGGVAGSDPAITTWLAQVSASDVCDGATTGNNAPSFYPSGCDAGKTTTVAFTAVDNCANTSDASSSVTVHDTTPPALTVPGPLSLECNSPGGVPKTDPAIVAWLASAVASDICDGAVISNDAPDLFPSGCGAGATTVVHFTATDNCGLTTVLSASVTVSDTTAPTLTVPGPLTLECNSPGGVPKTDPAIVAWLAAAVASDICDGAVISNDAPDLFPSGCGAGATTVVHFTATDNCGLTTVLSATVTVSDTTAPALTVPDPLTLECNSPGGVPKTDPAIVAWLASAVASDICDGAVISNDAPDFFPSGCGAGTTTVVHFTAVDNCGNATILASSVTVRDTTAPMLTVPDPLTLECDAAGGVLLGDPQVQAWLAAAKASDICGTAKLTNDAPALFPSGCVPGMTTTVTFTASDECGNAAVATSTITVRDTTPPDLAGCGLEPWDPILGAPKEPQPPGSPSSCLSSAQFRVQCGKASDLCDSQPVTTTAHIVASHFEVVDETCVEVVDAVAVACGEVVELHVLAPPCPSKPPKSPHPPVWVNSQGVKVIEGEKLRLEVSASDGCDNLSTPCLVDPLTAEDPTNPGHPLLCPPKPPKCDGPLCGAGG